MARALVHVPANARRGDIVEIKTLIAHPMETGYRTGINGQLIPRDIIQDFVCTYDGEEVFRATFYPAIAANPYVTFFTVATESGTLAFSWTDQHGATQVQTAAITVE